MGRIPSNQLVIFTKDDWQGFSAIQWGGPALEDYDATGNPNLLPSKNMKSEVAQLCYYRGILESLGAELIELKTSRALGIFLKYSWTYASVSGDPDFLPWSVVSGRRPANDNQIVLFVAGQIIKDYSVGSLGITLGTALIAGQTATALILSDSLGSAHTDFVFLGKDGAGAGNLVWTLASLGEDIYGQTIETFPSASNKVWVFLNGVFQDYDIGISVTGTGSSTVVTFAGAEDFEIGDDEKVTFIIWSA